MLMVLADKMIIIAGRLTMYTNVPTTILRQVLAEHGGITSGQIPELVVRVEHANTAEAAPESMSAGEEEIVDKSGCRWVEDTILP